MRLAGCATGWTFSLISSLTSTSFKLPVPSRGFVFAEDFGHVWVLVLRDSVYVKRDQA